MDEYEQVQQMRGRMAKLQSALADGMTGAAFFGLFLREVGDEEAREVADALFSINLAIEPLYERLHELEARLY